MREVDDATAYMMLATCNAQSELTALERGLHAMHAGMSVRDYAALVGQKPTWTEYQRQAAEVFTQVNGNAADLTDKTKHLVEIHAARPWLWPALVAAMLPSAENEKGWTVEKTRAEVARLKGARFSPAWADGFTAAGGRRDRQRSGLRRAIEPDRHLGGKDVHRASV